MKNVISILILSGLTSALISGCGSQGSNPTKDFKLNTVPNTDAQNKNAAIGHTLMKIDVVGSNDVNFVNFTENQAGQVRFNVRVLDTHVTEVELTALEGTMPAGATLTRAPNSPTEWILSWTPQKNIVLPGTAYYSTIIQLAATVVKTSDPQLANGVAQSSVQIIVTRTNQTPSIEGSNQLAAVVEEGVSTSFSIVVNDPAKMPAPPTLQVYPYDVTNNREAYKANGSGFVIASVTAPSQDLGNGRVKYNFTFDTRNQELPYPLNISGQRDSKAPGVELCFNVKALSPSGNQSPERTICTKVRYAAQAPDVNFEDQSPVTQLTTGVPALIKFTVQSPNGRGTVGLENMTSKFSSWSGKPTFKCDEPTAGQETVQTCQIDWNVPCNATTGKRILTFKATGKLGKQVRTKTVTREIVVSNSADTCNPEPKAEVAPAPAKPAPAPKKKAVAQTKPSTPAVVNSAPAPTAATSTTPVAPKTGAAS